MAFLWLKALHIIAVISWMAGLLYLPRLFVNHAGRPQESEGAQMLTGMERRLMVFIMRPAAVVTLLTGGGLLSVPGVVDWGMGWIWVKLAAVLVLLGMHGACEGWKRQFAAGTNRRPARFFRIVNEVPTLAMVVIVILVVLKPF